MNGSQPREHLPTVAPSIGLALGGGGARGIAHILVLEVLEEMGIRPSIVAGTSIGALIGAAYASGMSANHIRAHLTETLGDRFYLIRQIYGARSQPVQRFLNMVPLRSALLDPVALLDLVLPTGLPATIEECAIPFRAIATDMQAHDSVIFDRGNLKERIAASIAIPVLFSPVQIEGRIYADGGLVNPLPLDAIRGAADISVGVDVTGGRDAGSLTYPPSVTTMLVHSVLIFQHTIIQNNLRVSPPDVYLDVNVGRFGFLQFNRVDEILAAAEPAKDILRRKLERALSA
ncbi:MAG: patatin-like phospholipase family protein, partial [Alphaproteobacteria bacterium]|nr:patatin-like phospholipase family protein [Alphaproteobacteria bacterium]